MDFVRIFSVVFALALISGCTSPFTPSEQSGALPNGTPSCTTEIVSEPYNETVCQNVSEVREVCGTRKLNYTMTDVVKSELCLEKGLCVVTDAQGKCLDYYCSMAMARCTANITNLDLHKRGEWSIDADFSIDGSVFHQNPVKKSIEPGKTAVFDFQQMYAMDINQLKASCELIMISTPEVQDCTYVTQYKEVCQQVQKYRDIEKQNCS